MFIQEIIVDGFKSYAHRTVIEGFDPHFNAITGLNGSGKSNILDSICFVLGITNLSQVRAGNLSELVYKQGQAGVNKASVTIVFNNNDPDNSPVGFEKCDEVTVTRQVLLGGKNKYMINGRNALASAVQNLFHSVQLNVNNPHFLIMQGRITKVLNMRSHEILGMVEEAAGTRMYENKRVSALKCIDKKQAKLDEINTILEEDITPTLERLRGEKQNYLKWSKNSADVERLERFCVAHQFYASKLSLEENKEEVATMQEKVAGLEGDEKQFRKQIELKENEIEQRMMVLNGDLDGRLAATKKLEQERSNELVRATSKWKICRETVTKAQNDLDVAHQLVQETEEAMAEKETEIASLAADENSIIEEAAAADRHLQKVTTEYQSMSAGIDVENRSLPEQISKAHADSKTAEAKIKQAKLKVTHLSKELKVVENEMKKEGKSAQKLAEKKEKAASDVQALQEQITELDFSDIGFDALDEQKLELESAVNDLTGQVNTLQARLNGRLKFEYSDPVRGFDRSKVKGTVASLVEVKSAEYTTALEVVAGGKLFQVVVDEAVTGKALLGRGKLKKRCTIIPLDKIQARHVTASAVKRAENIAQSLETSAKPAIELVGFEEEIRNAMEYVFGSSIVAGTKEAAEQICFATKTRTITREGDTYDPSGTVSGGSKGNFGTTLAQLVELADLRKQLNEKTIALRGVTSQLKALKSAKISYDKLATKLNFAQATLDAASKHVSQTSFGLLVERKASYTSDLTLAEEEIEKMTKEMEEKWGLYEELKEQEVELTRKREERLVNIEQTIKDAKTDAAEKTKLARESESRAQVLSLELDNLKKEKAAAEDAARAARLMLNEAMQKEAETQAGVEDTQAHYGEAQNELEKIKKSFSECSQEVDGMKHEVSGLLKEAENAKLEAKKLVVVITRIRKEREVAERTVGVMLKKYSWIEGEARAFGVSGGDYDFDASSPDAARRQLHELRGEQDNLSKKINKKVMGMIEKAEGEYAELLRKRKVVENDKKKIQSVIKELDVKKKSELEITWKKVNEDFGSVFSTLLPGAKSKLEPPEGMEAWEGLEVKVAFGDEWKESLTELSGGQRSLLALSLILALLLFKPAPMYILDEVDAALDLSHTQNIGNMLKTHFSQSQFIVVSLKEGMFNNANVIFRTKFVDGVSTVIRTIGTGSSRVRSQLSQANGGEEVEETNKAASRRNQRKRGKENA